MPRQLQPGLDYYVEEGRWVFTAHFLRSRGYCCFNGCRHCPFGQAGRGRAAAFADLQRRLEELEARLEAEGLALELVHYRDGTLTVLPPAQGCVTDRAGLEAAVRHQAEGLLTVCTVAWQD